MNAGAYSLGTFNVTDAGTQTGDWTEVDFEGLIAACAQVRLVYGSGGTSVKAYLQTTIDEATTPVDIACVVFGTASEVAVLNFSALTPKTTQVTPGDATLTDDTAVDGILGDRFRLKVVSTGTYAGSTVLTGNIVVR